MNKNFFDELDQVTQNRNSINSNPFESVPEAQNTFGESEGNPFGDNTNTIKPDRTEPAGNPFGEIPSSTSDTGNPFGGSPEDSGKNPFGEDTEESGGNPFGNDDSEEFDENNPFAS